MSIYPAADPGSTFAMIEGYVRQYVLYSESAEISAVDRAAQAGVKRTSITGLTQVQVPPGYRCVQLSMKTCTAGSCAQPTVCAFTDYFIAGQNVQLKAGSLKLQRPLASGDAVVDATIEAEVAAKGFATASRRIAMKCGNPIQGVCERESPGLPRQAIVR